MRSLAMFMATVAALLAGLSISQGDWWMTAINAFFCLLYCCDVFPRGPKLKEKCGGCGSREWSEKWFSNDQAFFKDGCDKCAAAQSPLRRFRP